MSLRRHKWVAKQLVVAPAERVVPAATKQQRANLSRTWTHRQKLKKFVEALQSSVFVRIRAEGSKLIRAVLFMEAEADRATREKKVQCCSHSERSLRSRVEREMPSSFAARLLLPCVCSRTLRM